MELEQFPILKEFEVVFCDKISVLPPKRYLDFNIDLMLFSTLVGMSSISDEYPIINEMNNTITWVAIDKGYIVYCISLKCTYFVRGCASNMINCNVLLLFTVMHG